MKRCILMLALIVPTVACAALERSTFPLSALLPTKISGFVKHESYWDTRQVVGTRDDEILIFPEPKKLDCNCQDINAQGQFQMVPVKSRLRFSFEGNKVKNANLYGAIETDFAGKSSNFNILRLRLAFVELKWEKVWLLAGQFWHPTNYTPVSPRVVSSNDGRPIAINSRNPQVRCTYHPTENLSLLFAATTELDNTSDGPIGPSSTYMRNSVIPMLDFRIVYEKEKFILGVDAEYKRITPRIVTDNCFKTRESLSSAVLVAFNQFVWNKASSRTQFIFSQNGRDINLMGGYAVSCEDECTQRQEYTNLNQISLWNDTEFKLKYGVTPGWFIGVSKTLGASSSILCNEVDDDCKITKQRIFGRGSDIDTLFRFAPRVKWRVNNFMFSTEVEYTRAAYGTITCDGDVVDTCPVSNTRLLVTMHYFL